MRLRYRRQAERDIDNIHSHIEMDNPRAAVKVVARVRYAAERLAIFPYMGHEGLSVGTYEWVVAGLPYIIVYEVDEVGFNQLRQVQTDQLGPGEVGYVVASVRSVRLRHATPWGGYHAIMTRSCIRLHLVPPALMRRPCSGPTHVAGPRRELGF